MCEFDIGELNRASGLGEQDYMGPGTVSGSILMDYINVLTPEEEYRTQINQVRVGEGPSTPYARRKSG